MVLAVWPWVTFKVGGVRTMAKLAGVGGVTVTVTAVEVDAA